MQVNANQAADFIKILHPTLESNNLSHVAISCCEATGWNTQSQYTQQLKSAGVENLLGIITGHTYTSGIGGPQPTTRKVWETECSDLSGGWSTSWYSYGGAGDGYTWANNIYTGLTTGNVSAYLWVSEFRLRRPSPRPFPSCSPLHVKLIPELHSGGYRSPG